MRGTISGKPVSRRPSQASYPGHSDEISAANKSTIGSSISGNPIPAFLPANMCRNSPEEFFANGPDTVGDIIQKTPLSIYAFGHGKVNMCISAGETEVLVTAAIPMASEVQEMSSRQCRPLVTKGSLTTSNMNLTDLSGKTRLSITIFSCRKWLPLLARDENRL